MPTTRQKKGGHVATPVDVPAEAQTPPDAVRSTHIIAAHRESGCVGLKQVRIVHFHALNSARPSVHKEDVKQRCA
ncbi:MAG: hypothetical protein WCO60_10605 [Verrucomicrobiota bacterium]